MKLKKVILTAAVSLAALTSASAFARDVVVSVSVGQPGFYGTVNVGRYPVERVVYEQPYVTYAPRVVRYEPVYHHAPRYHRHDRYYGPRHHSRYGGDREWRGRGHGRDDDRRGYRGGRGRDD